MIRALPLIAAALVTAVLQAETIDLTVRHAPYVVSTITKKTEKAWARCRFCGSKTSYERSFNWDVNNRVWVETTKAEDIPDVCRKCKPMIRDQEKIDRKERTLDAKIEQERSRIRVKEKERELQKLRNRAKYETS